MKRLSTLLAIAAITCLSACANPLIVTTSPATVSSTPLLSPHADAIGKAMQEVTLARQASTALATAGKITWPQDDTAQAALTVIRSNLQAALTLDPSDPAQAAQLLSAALTSLAVYQGASK